ncbi:MAG TPA: hypothetical protein VHX14_12960 [Thermoanaerobaculia bacterium]|jgi:hypothetical protein|nr:hypothetical protein [Thermoanaerobaculia bacterium]
MRRRHALLLAAFIALALITWLRVHLIDTLDDQGYFAKYLIFADRILAGRIPRDRLADLSPGYLWFVVLLRLLGASMMAIRTLQIVMVSFAAVCCAFAARRFGTMAMIAAPLLLLASRAALVCATEAEPETLILLLVSAGLAALSWSNATSGTLFGLASACRPVIMLGTAAIAIVNRSWKLIVAAIVPLVLLLIVNIALTGEVVLMDPGTVFYEGMNPSATGYEGVQPRIVNDIERTSIEPDYLHVAYRIVASRSAGRPLTRAESNRFWTAKALAFVRAYPRAALMLTLRKAHFAIHSHDAYDLATMARKDALLGRYPFIPFGAVLALAGAGVLLARERHRELLPFVIFALAGFAVLVVFYVTARQRNAILPAVAVLAATGISEIIARRHLIAAVAVLIIAILLGINGPQQIEDTNGWLGVRNAFDDALTLEQQGRWADADRLLAQVESEDYQPIRENRAVPSVAFYRARAAVHLGHDPRAQLDRATSDAPGNEHVLAMRARLGDQGALRLLFALHDAMTARRALAEQ